MGEGLMWNRYLGGALKSAVKRLDSAVADGLTELRVRVGRPLELRYADKSILLDDIKPDPRDLSLTLELISGHSLYAFADELRQGFVTIGGGHRVGVCGTVIVDNGGVITSMKNVSGLNFRVAREVKGAAKPLADMVMDGGAVKSAVVVSPPGRGKTTVLRDLARIVSDAGNRVAVIDERGEIAACSGGVPQNDVGSRTDVLDLCPKAAGMDIAVRALSPDVIVVDELAGAIESEAARRAVSAGAAVFCAAHGRDVETALHRAGLSGMVDAGVFGLYVLLAANGEMRIDKILGAF